MSLPSSVANYGTAICNQLYARTLFTSETDQDLNIKHLQNGTITIQTSGANSLIRLGGTTSASQVKIVEGTLTAADIVTTTISDGTLSIYKGTITSANLISANKFTDTIATWAGGSITSAKLINSATLTDGVATLTTGSLTNLGHLTSSVITDGTYTLNSGNFSSASSGTMTSAIGSFTTAYINDLNMTGSFVLNELSDGTAQLSNGTLSGLLLLDTEAIESSTNVTVNSLTDGTALLRKGSLTELRYLNSQTITDGQLTIQDGSVSNALVVESLSLTDGTALLEGGHLRGLNQLTSASITDSTMTINRGSLTNIVSLESDIIADGTLSITAGSLSNALFIETNVASISSQLYLSGTTPLNVSGNSSLSGDLFVSGTGSFTSFMTATTITDGTALLHDGSLTSITSLGVNISNPLSTVYLNTSDALRVPVGDSASRPTASQSSEYYGFLRYNTDDNQFEGYSTSGWSSVGGGGISSTLTDGTISIASGSLSGSVFLNTTIASITDTLIVGGNSNFVGSITAESYLLVDNTAYARTLTDYTASLYGGSITNLLNIASVDGSVSDTLYCHTLTDGTTNIFDGTISSALLVSSALITDGTASITGGNFITDNNVISQGTITSVVGSCTTVYANGGLFTGVVDISTLTTDEVSASFIYSDIGSFSSLYADDLFIADDVVINGNTTYVNSTQVSFDDYLLSLGADSGRSIASISAGKDIIYVESDVSYSNSDYIIVMNSSGSQEIAQVDTVDSNRIINLSSAISLSGGIYVARILTESSANGSGIEIFARDVSGNSRIKKMHYVYDATTVTNGCFEFVGNETNLDVRVTNLYSTLTSQKPSYFSVMDTNSINNPKHKKLLTSDALYLNTSNTGSITGGVESSAIYLSKNGDETDADGDWRLRINGGGASQAFILEQYLSSSWGVKFQIDP